MRDGGHGAPWPEGRLADGPLGAARRRVIAAARKLRAADLVDAVGSASAVAEARGLLADIHRAPTMPAVERYAGVVYDHLDVSSLSADARQRADRHVVIPSALFGPVRGGDQIPAYRLLMLATLPDPVGRLAPFWRPHVGQFLDDLLAPDAVVVDLLSSEYAAAVPASVRSGRTWLGVTFLDPGTGRKVPGAIGKQRKGALARHLLEAGDVTPDVVASAPGPLEVAWR